MKWQSTAPITPQIENHLFYFTESFLAIITVLRLISNTKVTGFKLQNNPSDWWELLVALCHEYPFFYHFLRAFKSFLKLTEFFREKRAISIIFCGNFDEPFQFEVTIFFRSLSSLQTFCGTLKFCSNLYSFSFSTTPLKLIIKNINYHLDTLTCIKLTKNNKL